MLNPTDLARVPAGNNPDALCDSRSTPNSPLRRVDVNCRCALLIVAVGLSWSTPAVAQTPYRIPTSEEDLLSLCGSRTYGVYEKGTHCGWASESFVTSRVRGQDVFVWEYQQHLTTAIGAEIAVSSVFRREVFLRKAPFSYRGDLWEEKTLVRERSSGRTREIAKLRMELVPAKFGFTRVVTHRGQERSEPAMWAGDYRATDRRGVGRYVTAPASLKRSYWPGLENTFGGVDVSRTIRVTKSVGSGESLRHHMELSYGPDLLAQQVYDGAGWRVSLREGTLQLRAERPERAKREVLANAFKQESVGSRHSLSEASQGRSLRLLVLGEGAECFRKGPGQRVRKVPGGVEVEVDHRYGPKPTPTAWERRRALEETLEIPVKDPRIQRMARRAVGQARDPKVRVLLLARFVSKRLRYSTKRDTFSVLTTLEHGAGDCTEFAALFTALARALGIPCRRVTGLAYLGDEARAFGWHAWCEVAVRGSWLPVDPGWNAVPPPLTHLRLCDEFSYTGSPGSIRIELAPKAKPAKTRTGPGPTMIPR